MYELNSVVIQAFSVTFSPKKTKKNMKTYKSENNFLLLHLIKTSKPRTSGTRKFEKPFLKKSYLWN